MVACRLAVLAVLGIFTFFFVAVANCNEDAKSTFPCVMKKNTAKIFITFLLY